MRFAVGAFDSAVNEMGINVTLWILKGDEEAEPAGGRDIVVADHQGIDSDVGAALRLLFGVDVVAGECRPSFLPGGFGFGSRDGSSGVGVGAHGTKLLAPVKRDLVLVTVHEHEKFRAVAP